MRLPVVPQISTKDGTSNRNARLTNCLKESKKGGDKAVVRPGLVLDAQASGVGNGLVVFNNELVSVYGATVRAWTGEGAPFNVVTDIFYMSLDGVVSDAEGHSLFTNGTPAFSAGQVQCGNESYFVTNPALQFIYTNDAGATDMAVGTADFTVEAWWYMTDAVGGTIFRRTEFGGIDLEIVANSATWITVNWSDWTMGYGSLDSMAVPSLLNRFAHIALVRTLGDMVLYVDGIELARTTDGGLSVDDDPGGMSVSILNAKGYWSQFRFATGAKYTDRFYPSCNLNNAGYFDVGTVTSDRYDFAQSPL